jgi:hypothetical protein
MRSPSPLWLKEKHGHETGGLNTAPNHDPRAMVMAHRPGAAAHLRILSEGSRRNAPRRAPRAEPSACGSALCAMGAIDDRCTLLAGAGNRDPLPWPTARTPGPSARPRRGRGGAARCLNARVDASRSLRCGQVRQPRRAADHHSGSARNRKPRAVTWPASARTPEGTSRWDMQAEPTPSRLPNGNRITRSAQ